MPEIGQTVAIDGSVASRDVVYDVVAIERGVVS
jgi:hypothetical protein